MNKLEKISIIKGKIRLKTGLHIGAGKEIIEIGGIDNPVIRDPKTGYPYIPGSSLKGKIRCLLELKHDKTNGKNPCNCGNCIICQTFGNTNKEAEGITRIIFRDSFLTDESIEDFKKKNMSPTEAKMENTINRLNGTAYNPRTTERVIAGLRFNLEIALRVFEGDENKSIDLVKEGLQLLRDDSLGGSGSRGYGQIDIEILKIDDADMTL